MSRPSRDRQGVQHLFGDHSLTVAFGKFGIVSLNEGLKYARSVCY